MLQNQIKTIFNSAVSKVVDNIDQYTFSPEKDLKRHKKLPADKLISFLISEGSASTKLELLDFFNLYICPMLTVCQCSAGTDGCDRAAHSLELG